MSVPIRAVQAETAPQRIPHYINGQRVSGDGQSLGPVYNPATGRQTGELPLGDAATVDAAARAAAEAFVSWSQTPPIRRARMLFRFRDILEANADALADQLTAE